MTSDKPWSNPPEDLLRPTPNNMYDWPAPRPNIVWEEFPTDMTFEDYHVRAESFGMQHTPTHGRILFTEARIGIGEGYIIETGTYWASGACYAAAGSKTARREKVITIDIDRGHKHTMYSSEFYDRVPGGIARAYMNALMMGVQDWIISIRGSVEEVIPLLNMKVRLAHVDGGHDADNCGLDVVLIEPLMISGAKMVFHDYNSLTVQEAIEKYVKGASWCDEFVVLSSETAYAVKR